MSSSPEHSDSDSDAIVTGVARKTVSVPLTAIPTIRQLYASKELNPSPSTLAGVDGDDATHQFDGPRYPVDDGLLDRISLYQGDITKLEIDSIVNAANSSLLGGGGVDGAIHSAAGPQLVEECRLLGGCSVGDARITKGYRLPAAHVIHTVGPKYFSAKQSVEEKAALLASAYKTSFELAVEHSRKQIAFPSISTGIYGYPIADATHIALDEARKFCRSEAGKNLERVIFVVWSDRDKRVYERLIPEYFPLAEVPKTTASDSEAT